MHRQREGRRFASPSQVIFSAARAQRRKSGLDCLSAASFQAARSAPLAALEMACGWGRTAAPPAAPWITRHLFFYA